VALTHYEFHSVWHVAAPPAVVFDVLIDLESYPAWWPEVKAVRHLGQRRYETICKATLPYRLTFKTTQGHYDFDLHVVEGLLSGDLNGFSRWQVFSDNGGSRLVYDQEVMTGKPLLNRLAPVARPVFRANHTLMMRHGESGLRTYLAGLRRGRGI
jgi:carbon monoxide dehydrogenase subunit G